MAVNTMPSLKANALCARKRVWIEALRFLFLATVAFAIVFGLRWTPPLPHGNSTIFLVDALRMNRGEVLYRDFFELTFPGTEWYYALLMRWMGASALVPALTMAGLATLGAWLTRLVSKRVVGEKSAFIAALAVLAFPVLLANDPTHHWFSAVLVMGATAVALQGSARAQAAAGLMCGVAAFFTQTAGFLAAVALCAWWLWRGRRGNWRACLANVARVTTAFSVTTIGLAGYFAARAGPRTFWESTIVFPLRNYGALAVNTWRVYGTGVPGWHAAPERLAFLVVHAIEPGIYVLAAGRLRKMPETALKTVLVLVEMVGIAMFVAVASAPSAERLATASLPAIVLLAWFVEQPGVVEKIARRGLWATVALTLVAGLLLRHARDGEPVRLPVGEVTVASEGLREEIAAVSRRVSPGNYCFGNPAVEFALQLRAPAPVLWLSATNYTSVEQERATIASLETKRVPLLLLSPSEYLSGAHDTSRLAAFREYLSRNYRLDASLPSANEIWVRR